MDIVVLWLLIVMTLILFWERSRVAGALMLPYALWVGFASALNFQIWRLN
jgi:tryptophan-rich sensory protein